MEIESRHIRTAGQFDPYGLVVNFAVIDRELLSGLCGPDPHHRVATRVVGDRPAEHLGADHPLLQVLEFSIKGVLDHQAKKILGALASAESMADKNPLQVLAYQYPLLGAENFLFPRRM